MQASPRPRAGRPAFLAGLVIVIIGASALVSELFPLYDRYVPLMVGIGLLVVFAFSRWYGALIGGSILTGLGAGLVVAEAFPSAAADGVGAVLGLGLGFVGIWAISEITGLKQRHWWPLVPGLILTVVGIGLAADAFANLSEVVVPMVVVVIGLVIMAAGLMTSRHTPQSGAV